MMSKSEERRRAVIDEREPLPQPVTRAYRYACHGCMKITGWFEQPVLNQITRCPHCNMEQLTTLENFIYDPENSR